jgi:hypothetical protein
MADRKLVTFRFTLPGALLLRAPVGAWPRAPRGVRLTVEAGGAVTVVSFDRLESYARRQALDAASAFLRVMDRGQGALTFPAVLTPANGESPIHYAVVVGAEVSIARTREKPHLGEAGAPQLALVGGG